MIQDLWWFPTKNHDGLRGKNGLERSQPSYMNCMNFDIHLTNTMSSRNPHAIQKRWYIYIHINLKYLDTRNPQLFQKNCSSHSCIYHETPPWPDGLSMSSFCQAAGSHLKQTTREATKRIGRIGCWTNPLVKYWILFPGYGMGWNFKKISETTSYGS